MGSNLDIKKRNELYKSTFILYRSTYVCRNIKPIAWEAFVAIG